MNQEWTKYQAWIAHFDILGFKAIIDNDNDSLTLAILQSSIDEIVDDLRKNVSEFEESVDYLFYADTFLIYSKSERVNDYPGFIRVSKNFITRCIYKRIPVRGAVSYGELTFGHGRKILMGRAFLESHVYGEDQNWLGLILTPSATSKLKEHDLQSIKNGFVNRDIPMRKYSIFDEEIYAYSFINGSTNFQCQLLPILREMMQRAPKAEKIKYLNTIKFIERHYKIHTDS